MYGFTIMVARTRAPIPDRACDWAAWVDGEEETTTCTGPTPARALAGLTWLLTEREGETSFAVNQPTGGSV
jgi:hypothetical protein